ncbi:MAG: bifunctional 2-polyprenyl-6-hydroxyphenol methylase/3-demethylubiquinol 3-O-methyltransferase UbiG, partial [Neisseriaceae bacterium]|nr:bifunctional 2-polyprenyl-6-hydroxyphenol methylase/3-demethylubiquinol 3-O-methyltransferase UbiG [Neisseriaceae bacterium]
MTHNVDIEEINKFSNLADKWWNKNGELKTLHDINPVRLAFIQEYVELSGKKVIDVGCGGGILSEALAQAGASVKGIDLADASLEVAQQHAHDNGLEIDYQKISAEQLSEELPNSFHGVVCMELLEHIPDPQSVINACAALAEQGGYVFFSTLNRNLKSYLHAIVAAEYVLRMLPRGTHEHKKFITPAELVRMARNAGLETIALRGMNYRPLTGEYVLSEDTSVNYL